jgi:hypothetical protein
MNERLSFTFEAAAGYDSQLPVEKGAVVGGNLASSGFSTLFGGSGSFTHGGRRLEFAASASTAFKYYQELERLDALSHGAAFGMGVRLPKGGRFEINEALAYSPSYLYQLFPQGESPALGDSIPLNPDYRIDDANSWSSVTRASLQFGPRIGTSFTSFAEYEVTKYQEDTAGLGRETQAVGADVSRSLSRRASFVAGYRYRTGEVGRSGPAHEHEVPIGVEYSPALSATRRLHIGVSAGPAWLKVTPSPLDLATYGEVPDYLYRIHASANVSYPFRRNWNAAFAYDRGVQYVMGLNEPLLSDGVRVSVNGLVSRRMDISAIVGDATATSPQSETNRDLDTYTGGIKVRYALSRSAAIYSEYLFYHYDQGGVIGLAPGLPRVFEQHGVRVGFTWFGEALGRQRGK